MTASYGHKRISTAKTIEELDEALKAYDWFMDKYTYEQMLYSFKPLKIESWYTEEEIKRITS